MNAAAILSLHLELHSESEAMDIKEKTHLNDQLMNGERRSPLLEGYGEFKVMITARGNTANGAATWRECWKKVADKLNELYFISSVPLAYICISPALPWQSQKQYIKACFI